MREKNLFIASTSLILHKNNLSELVYLTVIRDDLQQNHAV